MVSPTPTLTYLEHPLAPADAAFLAALVPAPIPTQQQLATVYVWKKEVTPFPFSKSKPVQPPGDKTASLFIPPPHPPTASSYLVPTRWSMASTTQPFPARAKALPPCSFTASAVPTSNISRRQEQAIGSRPRKEALGRRPRVMLLLLCCCCLLLGSMMVSLSLVLSRSWRWNGDDVNLPATCVFVGVWKRD